MVRLVARLLAPLLLSLPSWIGGIGLAAPAHAVCNAIPGAAGIHRGDIGVLNRPFASPGDLVAVDVNRAICDRERSPGLAATANEHVVTLLFEPPSGPTNAAVISDDCAGLSKRLQDCSGELGGGQVACFPATAADLLIATQPDPVLEQPTRRLFFRVPDTANVPDQNAFGGPAGVSYGLNGGHTLTGPTTVAVSLQSDPALPCSLATSSCQPDTGTIACIDDLYKLDGTCNTDDDDIDGLFGHFTVLPPPNDYAEVCSTGDDCQGSQPDILFTTDREGNVLIPWNYDDVVRKQGTLPVARIGTGSLQGFPAFDNTATPVRIPTRGFLTSHAPEGFPLPPVFTPLPDASTEASLFGSIDAPRGVMRIARTSPDGLQCIGGSFPGAPCTDAVDCDGGTCESIPATQCVGGDNDSSACTRDSDCPRGTCPLPELFEFRDRFADGGIGPVAIQGSQYDVAAQLSISLAGLQETDQLFTLVVNESVEGRDLNGDGDQEDFVVSLANRSDGLPVDIGFPAIRRVVSGPVIVPAVAAEADRVALLASESREGRDLNGDGDTIDATFRAFELGNPSPLASGLTAVGSTALGRPAVGLADGIAFFGAVEGSEASSRIERISTTDAGQAPDAPSGLPEGAHAAPDASGRQRFVTFSSTATDLPGSPADTTSQIYVRDRDTDNDGIFDEPGAVSTTLVSRGDADQIADGGSDAPWITPDGRFVAFRTFATNLLTLPVSGTTDGNDSADVYVRDRDADTDGILDEPAPASRTVRVSVDSAGAEALAPGACSGDALFDVAFSSARSAFQNRAQLTPDGRFAVFASAAPNLVANDLNGVCDVFLHDRDTDQDGVYDEAGAIATERISVDSSGVQGAFGSVLGLDTFVSLAGIPISNQPRLSDDGRVVAFTSLAPLVSAGAGDHFSCFDVYARDRDPDRNGVFEPGLATTQLASRRPPGLSDSCLSGPIVLIGASFSLAALLDAVSHDGRLVALTSLGGNLTTITNTFPFVFDTELGTLEQQVSGPVGSGQGSRGAFLDGGRLVTYLSLFDESEDASDPNLARQMVRDRQSGVVLRAGSGAPAELAITQGLSNQPVDRGAVFVAADMLDPNDGNGFDDVFASEADPTDPQNIVADLNGDGDLFDTYLQIVDIRDNVGEVFSVRAAITTAVAPDGTAATLVPERDFGGSSPGSILNGDGDIDDRVVHFYPGRVGGSGTSGSVTNPVQSLGLSGRDLALSRDVLVVLVSEDDEGQQILNADGDDDDAVVYVCDRAGGLPTCVNTERAGIDLILVGGVPDLGPDGLPRSGDEPFVRQSIAALEVDSAWPQPIGAAFLTREQDQGLDLNGDALLDDQVLMLATLDGTPVRPGGTGVAASEFSVGTDLIAFRRPETDIGDQNGDGDTDDLILQVYDLRDGMVKSSGSSAEVCELEACDPTQPYRVRDGTVRFLTRESAERRDLNGDLDADDLVVQLFNPQAPAGGQVEVLAEVEDVPEASEGSGLGIDPLAPPPFDAPDEASQIALSQGVCVEPSPTACSSDLDCAGDGATFVCDADAGACKRRGATCRADLDCVAGVETCEPDFTAVGTRDRDGDGIPDALDNCPDIENPEQDDVDADRVGDACDLQVCGNGTQEGSEGCDDGNLLNGDGCSRFCQNAGCFGDVNLDGDVNVFDTAAFDQAAGCFPCAGPDCNGACDANGDGIVNNTDVLALPGVLGTSCPSTSSLNASSACGLGFELVLLLGTALGTRRWVARLRESGPR